MGSILDFLVKNNENTIRCYRTRKYSLDSRPLETVAAENSDTDTIPQVGNGKLAETDISRKPTVKIHPDLIKNTPPYFKYFLDGSRHVYKVDNMAIGTKIYPALAGQICVGCCERTDREHFHQKALHRSLVLSLPDQFKGSNVGKEADFLRSYCEKLNDSLANNRYLTPRNLKFEKILLYKTDGPTVGEAKEKDRFQNSGTARIQNEMTDHEQLLVQELCKKNCLSADGGFLLKDGSIQYNPNYSNMDRTTWNNTRSSYNYVVGVSKSFNPELIQDYEKKPLSRTIADLQPFERTKAYLYPYSPKNDKDSLYAIWYLRIRNSNFRENTFSDIVKCEMLLGKGSQIESDLVDALSANLIREAYPVCYGADARWANHLYPVYLTETFCKAQYIDSDIFLSLF